MLPKLPLSIQTFSELRSKQYVYVDKTMSDTARIQMNLVYQPRGCKNI